MTDNTGSGADETFDVMSNQWWEYHMIESIRELAWKRDENVEPRRFLIDLKSEDLVMWWLRRISPRTLEVNVYDVVIWWFGGLHLTKELTLWNRCVSQALSLLRFAETHPFRDSSSSTLYLNFDEIIHKVSGETELVKCS